MKKLIKTLMPAIALVAAMAPAALAATTDTTTTQVGLSSGALSITAPTITTDFGTITLTGNSQTARATLSGFSVSDATGTAAGWKVNVQASQFTEVAPGGGFAGGTSAKTLPTGSMTIAPPSSATAVGGTTSPVPTAQIASNTVIDGGSAVKILSAAANEGMGSYNIAFAANALGLAVNPASFPVDKTNYPAAPTPYQSTITWSIVAGP